jgi:hypothetical protein
MIAASSLLDVVSRANAARQPSPGKLKDVAPHFAQAVQFVQAVLSKR